MVKKEDVAWVIMGNKGATSATTIIMGSNTLKVIRKLKGVPLLVVPEEIDFKPIEKMAFVTGFKRSYSKSEITPLKFIATLQKAVFKVVHIHSQAKMTLEQQDNLHELYRILDPIDAEVNWLEDDINMFYAIASYVESEAIDLLSLVYYKHNFFSRIFREPLLENITRYTSIPLLIVPKAQ